MAGIFWHNLSIPEVVKILKTDLEKGLGEEEIKIRQKEFGKNLLPEEKPLSRVKIFLEQFQSPLIYILVVAGFITLILKDFADSIVIFGAVILNTIVGFLQENKASKTLRELKKVVKIEAQVQREGNPKIIDSANLVPGDIFQLRAGDKVPADGRIVQCRDFKINEMALTGEWLSAKKKPEVLLKETPMADRDNMVYMGTIVEAGIGRAVVTETGSKTEIGKIAEMVKETKEEETPLQKKLSNFSRIIGVAIGIISFLIFIEGIATGNTFLEMFTASVAVAVAAIPEGLPVAMTVILALGAQRVLRKKGLIRHLSSTETLGSTSVICTDKTATLTEGKITVKKVLTQKDKNLIAKIAVLCNEAFVENPKAPKEKWQFRGRPTDKALLSWGLEAGFTKKRLEIELSKIDEVPFDNLKKFLATLHKSKNGNILFVAGAPEKILEISKMETEERKTWQNELENITGKGYRTIALAIKKTKSAKIKDKVLQNLEFVALLGLTDPLRKEVKEAIRICRQAGIRPIMATGDHKLTARSIAAKIGLKIKEENILEGKDLDKLSEKEFEKKINKIEVYSRMEPRHKMRIVETWQKKGEVVAMTGDGINDAPALKQADIGVALGSGTDVAKEASDLILLNDSFNIIVEAIKEGRAILDNIRKVITYLLSDSFSEVILIGGALIAGFSLPILPVQILWVNLIEDGLPDIALAFEPKEKDLMRRKPQGHDIPLLTREMKALIFIIGLVTDFLLLALFFWLWKKNYDIDYIRTMIFACLTIDSLLYVFSCKSLRRNLWHINPFSNKFLLGAVGIGALMLILALYLPLFQTLLKTKPLNFNDWLIVLGTGLIELILIEITKWYFITKKETR